MNLIQKFAEKLKTPKRIAVIGDILIDEYYPVSVTRLSPEHPIPVFHTPDEACTTRPGGAANVCHQFKHLNTELALFGFLNPYAIKCLTPEIKEATKCNSVVDENCRVPVKKRYYDKGKEFPMCRIDVETTEYGLGKNIDQWRNQLRKQFLYYRMEDGKVFSNYDAVICSDYNKGLFDKALCQDIIKHCNESNTPIIVDPKKNYMQWKGCTYFKHNEAEAIEFSSLKEKDWKSIAHKIKLDLGCKNVIITQGSKGFTSDSFDYVSDKQVEARSVIGAGDCFAAFFALAIAHNFNPKDAAEIAFHAGAVYVQKIHNEPVSVRDLLIDADPILGKIITANDLSKIIEKDTANKYVFTNGCFDIVHAGHIETLSFAKSKGTKLIVALNSDESIKQLKGEDRPLTTWNDRAKVIAALSCVDYVVDFNENTPYNLLTVLKPHVLVKGGDYKIEDVVGTELVDEVFLTPLVEGRSTTNLIDRIRKCNHWHPSSC